MWIYNNLQSFTLYLFRNSNEDCPYNYWDLFYIKSSHRYLMLVQISSLWVVLRLSSCFSSASWLKKSFVWHLNHHHTFAWWLRVAKVCCKCNAALELFKNCFLSFRGKNNVLPYRLFLRYFLVVRLFAQAILSNGIFYTNVTRFSIRLKRFLAHHWRRFSIELNYKLKRTNLKQRQS